MVALQNTPAPQIEGGTATLPMDADMHASADSHQAWETFVVKPAPVDTLQVALETVIKESLGSESSSPVPMPALARTLADVGSLSSPARLNLKGSASPVTEAAGMEVAIAASLLEATLLEEAEEADALAAVRRVSQGLPGTCSPNVTPGKRLQDCLANAAKPATGAVTATPKVDGDTATKVAMAEAATPAVPAAPKVDGDAAIMAVPAAPPMSTGDTADAASRVEGDVLGAARKAHRAQYMALDRACKNPARTPPALMLEWAKGNHGSRMSLLKSWLASEGDIAAVSMDLIRMRQKTTSLTDRFEYLNKADIMARLTSGQEGPADEIIRSCAARGGRFARADPNCPNIKERDQFWVVVSTSGKISDMLSEHEKLYTTVEMDATEAATMLGRADELSTGFGQEAYGAVMSPIGAVPKAKAKAKAKAAATPLLVENPVGGEEATNIWTARDVQIMIVLCGFVVVASVLFSIVRDKRLHPTL